MSDDVPERWNRPIFVASMGRSGSTLLQRILNVHPDITIWGEHGGFLAGILQSYELASEPTFSQNLENGYEDRDMVIGELSDKEAFKPWVSPFRSGDFEQTVEDLVRNLFTAGLAPSIRWGFKEIRYTDKELRTLMRMFPDAHLVVLVRDLQGFVQSRFFAFGYSDFDFESEDGISNAQERAVVIANRWLRRYEGYLSVRDAFADRVSVISYADLVVGSPRPSELFTDIGEEPPDTADLEPVLGAVSGSSFTYNSAARDNRDTLHKILEDSEVDWDRYNRIAEAIGL